VVLLTIKFPGCIQGVSNNRTNVIVRKLTALIRTEHMITTHQFCV
jgi:hypothetical protein